MNTSIFNPSGRTRYSQRHQTKPVSLTVEEHQRTAERLQRIAGELRMVWDLLRTRYPDTARCRGIAAQADATVAALRLSMACILNTETPSAGIDYTREGIV